MNAGPQATPASWPPSSKLKTFLRRLLSTVILWAVVLGAMFSGNAILSNAVFLLIMCTLTVVGLLVYSIIQRQVRLHLRTHAQQIPGNKGLTAIPTAAVVLSLFVQVPLVQFQIDDQDGEQVYGVQPHHLLCCDALGLDRSWYEG